VILDYVHTLDLWATGRETTGRTRSKQERPNYPDSEHWTQNTGLRTLDSELPGLRTTQTQNTGLRTLDSEHWTQNFPDSEHWTQNYPDSEHWTQDTGLRTLDSGHWTQNTGLRTTRAHVPLNTGWNKRQHAARSISLARFHFRSFIKKASTQEDAADGRRVPESRSRLNGCMTSRG